MTADRFPRAISLAHQLIESRVLPGDIVVDATIGNGHDTLFLAQLVGPDGHVFGFDIQPLAMESTLLRLKDAGMENVTLIQENHASLSEHIGGPVKAAMFNLGYLPKGEKSIITEAESTLMALHSLCNLDAEIVTIVAYTGHEGGDSEAEAVASWAESLDQSRFTAIRYEFLNQKNNPPFLLAIEKKK